MPDFEPHSNYQLLSFACSDSAQPHESSQSPAERRPVRGHLTSRTQALAGPTTKGRVEKLGRARPLTGSDAIADRPLPAAGGSAVPWWDEAGRIHFGQGCRQGWAGFCGTLGARC
jgi:hypothetical protein